MPNIEHVIDSFKMHHADGDEEVLRRVHAYSASKHEGQKRRSGEPYIQHPMSVAKIVADMGLCEPSICAAFLHDVIEDTDTTQEQLSDKFGADVAMLVEGLTKLDKVHFEHREQHQAESFRKMLIATVSDIRVLLIKLADRLHNMSTLDSMPQHKQVRISQETRDIYSPLAGRLGLAWLKAELDDLAFKYMEPEDYKTIYDGVKQTRKKRVLFINSTKRKLLKLLGANGYNMVEVSGRLKNLYSIYRKMHNKDLKFEEVHDAIAFRVICERVEQCYGILGIVHGNWTPVPGFIRDYIAMPKANNYRSLQTTVVGNKGDWMEIQIRTRQMHEVAEYGIAAHWAYKEGLQSTDLDIYKWLRGILEAQDDLDDSKEFFDSVKDDLLHQDIYVLTPRGDIKTLSVGSTPIDFAYSIHSEVGDHCQAAKVNGEMVSFDYVLRSGDKVDIVTSVHQSPSRTWLDYARTSRARNKIKLFLRTEERKQSVSVGENLLKKALRAKGLSYDKIIKSEAFIQLPSHKKYSNLEGFLAAIGHGTLDEDAVVSQIIEIVDGKKSDEKLSESTFEKVKRSVKWKDEGIVIDGVDNLLISFAKCCNPLPGEAVIGYISRGRGIIVHRRDCKQSQYLEKDRQAKVVWSADKLVHRPAEIEVVCADRSGILAAVTAIFDDKNVNISSIKSKTGGSGRTTIKIGFVIDTIANFNYVSRRVRGIKGVLTVKRTS